jgi:Xaa-Pro aminopeptidase
MSNAALELTRKFLKDANIDAFIVGSGDAHQSEYVSAADERRQFVSNFTGSAGTALILQDRAFLWTDGRYFLQAGNELTSEWTLMKSGQPGVLELADWVAENMTSGQTIGVDPLLIPNGQATTYKALFASKGMKFVGVDKNPVDRAWQELGQPTGAVAPVSAMDLSTTGQSHTEKIEKLQNIITQNGCVALLVTMLDEVAWLLNIRGEDIVYNPVALCYAVVTLDQTHLFIDPTKVTEAVLAHLGPRVTVQPYEEVAAFLSAQAALGRVQMDPAQVNWRLYQCVDGAVKAKTSPITLAKSLKNPVELAGFRECHIRDGAALTAFFHWLELTVKGGAKITEYEVTEKMEEFRGRMKFHKGPSFGTIAAYGPNAAMMHYSPSKESSAVIGTESTFLCDSGAQYLDGTTDVTR